MKQQSTNEAVSRHERGQEGFTLIELVISSMILAMVMAGAYALISQAGKMTRTARDHYIAVTLANNRIERARNLEYGELYLYEESKLIVDENGNPDPNGNYRRTTTIDTNFASGVTRVICTVEFKSVNTGDFVIANTTKVETVETLMTSYLDIPSS